MLLCTHGISFRHASDALLLALLPPLILGALLMMKRTLSTLSVVTLLGAGLYLAGCDASMTGNDDLAGGEAVDALQTASKGAKIDICHLSDEGGYTLTFISVLSIMARG